MKKAFSLLLAAAAATAAIAAYEAVPLAPGAPVRVPKAGRLAQVQILAGTNAVSGASVSLIRGAATNAAVSGASVSAGALAAFAPTNTLPVALPGDALLLSAGATNAVRATAILEL